LNGTYVNLKRVAPGGFELKNGDLILLATLDVGHPNPNTPGVASLRFHEECK
jgi:pSer/pThr/pTyr-binding forkhead associated (FHA) protein